MEKIKTIKNNADIIGSSFKKEEVFDVNNENITNRKDIFNGKIKSIISTLETNRVKLKQNNLNWANDVSDIVLEKFGDKDIYTVAAGISPSGAIHFGNFRDVMTSLDIFKSLEKKGKNVRFIFSWDDYDRFRKVPVGVPREFEKYIGMPLSKVPDPKGEYESYAKRYQVDFEKAMGDLGIEMEYIYQTKEYESGRYIEGIMKAIEKREIIAKDLLSKMSEKSKNAKGIIDKEYIESFYPISVYSKFTGKDNTKIISNNGTKIRYLCLDTNQEDEIDIQNEPGVKLNWKIDWPMRWKEEGVVFEPGGADHATPGGSYDVSYNIAKEVYGIEGPVFVGYDFIGIQGLKGKMSGSSGNSISTSKLLDVYEPELLKFLYLKKSPKQSFNLAFDSEIYRQYDEFDRIIKKVIDGNGTDTDKRILENCGVNLEENRNNVPIRQAVSFGQIVQFDTDRFQELMSIIGNKYSRKSVEDRLSLAKKWLEEYNKDETISIFKSKNIDFYNTLNDDQKEKINTLAVKLGDLNISLEELNTLVYEIPKDVNLDKKENSIRQKEFFRNVYNLLIGKDVGPRLSTFLFSLDRNQVLNLLDFK